MKLLVAFLIIAFFGPSIGSPTRIATASTLDLLARQDAPEEPGCNANVCFMIDSNFRMSRDDFFMQKEFILNVAAAIAGTRFEATAVQIGLCPRPITPLTSDVDKFFLDVLEAPFNMNRLSFLAGGMIYCTAELNERPNEAKKIVIIGNGRSLFGTSRARKFADDFRTAGGDVCGVLVGTTNQGPLLDVVGGPDKLFQVDDFFQLGTLIEDLVLAICGAPQPFGEAPQGLVSSVTR